MSSSAKSLRGSLQLPSPVIVPTPIGSMALLESGDARLAALGASSSSPSSRKTAWLLRDAQVFLNLLMSVIGAGMLSLPFTFVVMPVAQAVAMVVVVGVCMASTALALLHAHAHVAMARERATFVGAGRHVASYRSVAIAVAGPALRRRPCRSSWPSASSAAASASSASCATCCRTCRRSSSACSLRRRRRR
ncbi:hypothetical protein PINS_up016457 [Pythium insidiosum]|nr:hypothetical protein PINS_up016457 [Pythium insidiosum]